MKKNFLVLFASLTVLLTGCASFPTHDIVIEAETNPRINISGFKTFAWLPTTAILNDPEGKWQPLNYDLNKEVKFLVNRGLRERGIAEVSANPDLIVTYFIGVDMAALKIKEDKTTNMKLLKNVPKGALFVVLIDTSSGYVVWASRAKAEFKSLESKIAKQRLEYVVNNMFKKFPAKQ